MKRKLIFLIVLALVLTSVPSFIAPSMASVSAAPIFERINFVDATVNASVLNVRQGPATSFRVVCTLKKGQKVKIFGKINGWYAVYEMGTGCVGCSDARFLTIGGVTPPKAPTPTPAPVPKTPTPAPVPKTPTPAPTPSTKTPAPTPTPTPAPTPSAPPAGVSAEEQQMLNLVNGARAKAGVGALQFDTELQKMARVKAQDMVNNNYFAHESPTYGSPFDMMKQFGISFRSAGENIAGNQSVDAAFNAWMNSPGHKANILNGNFNLTGIGIVPSKTYGKIFVQEFIGR